MIKLEAYCEFRLDESVGQSLDGGQCIQSGVHSLDVDVGELVALEV